MSHDNEREASGPPRDTDGSAPDLAAVSAFLRALAARVERDSAFGREVRALLAQTGLLSGGPAPQEAGARGSGSRRAERVERTAASNDAASLPDPFVVLRQAGVSGLRERLAELDVVALRQIVRVHRLDPARISARWSARERLVDLIVAQVRARSDHGKAFARI